MKKTLGIFLILVGIVAAVVVWELARYGETNFVSPGNVSNIAKWTGLFGILAIGAAFVIITGGIDLSIGSVVGLAGVTLPWLLQMQGWSAWAAVPLVLIGSLCIGLAHGLLITKLKVQPFVVTLCGLFIYRGLGRALTGDSNQGFGAGYQGLRSLSKGKIAVGPEAWELYLPAPFLILLLIGLVAAVFLNTTIYGRYLLALGRNEEATRFSGIKTDRMIICAYVICSGLAGFGGMLFAFDVGSIQPSGFGNFYELYAIAGAVLGGCSLRGGEGSILGVIFGTAIVRVLRNAINILGIPSQHEFTVIGIVILLGVLTDELLRRAAAKRRAIRNARAMAEAASSERASPSG